jgi:hypothetical protein
MARGSLNSTMIFGARRRTAWVPQSEPSGTLALERAVEIVPSWDCTQSCHHEQKANHGIGGERIRFLLRATDVGAVLTLSTNLRKGRPFYRRGPEETGGSLELKPHISPDYLHDHLAMRTDPEIVRNDTQPESCDVLASGFCYGGEMQCLVAESMWTADDTWAVRHQLTVPSLEELLLVSPHPVWKRLTDYLLASRDKMLTAHAQLPHRCPMCHGAGLVPSVSLSQFNPPLP